MDFILPDWEKNSYKGERGKVLVIGGSAGYYGAPILTALGAEHAGADLITLLLPNQHKEIAKSYSLNFFIHSFGNENDIAFTNLDTIIKLTEKCDAMVIGNGLKINEENIKALLAIFENISVPVIIDAGALQAEILQLLEIKKSYWILTPHKKEFERVFDIEATLENLTKLAKKRDLTICLKGVVDYVADKNSLYENRTGIPEMRIGGTGDVLAGIIASYVAQGIAPFEASCSAVYHYGKCAEKLLTLQKNFTALELIRYYGHFFKN